MKSGPTSPRCVKSMWPTPWAPSMRAQDTEFFVDCHECFPGEACTRECENCIEHGEFRPFALRLQVSDDRAAPTYDFVVFDRVANVDLVGLHQTGLGYRLKSFRTRSVMVANERITSPWSNDRLRRTVLTPVVVLGIRTISLESAPRRRAMASRLSLRSLGYVYRMNVFGRGSVSDCSWRWYSWTTFGIVLKDP